MKKGIHYYFEQTVLSVLNDVLSEAGPEPQDPRISALFDDLALKLDKFGAQRVNLMQ